MFDSKSNDLRIHINRSLPEVPLRCDQLKFIVLVNHGSYSLQKRAQMYLAEEQVTSVESVHDELRSNCTEDDIADQLGLLVQPLSTPGYSKATF